MTIAEIVEEGERLERKATPGCGAFVSEVNAACMRRDNFYLEHGPTLLAVAKAAVEMREAETEPAAPEIPYPFGPLVCHKTGCHSGAIGKKWGPCNCGGRGLQDRINASRAAFDAVVRDEAEGEKG